MTRSMVMLFTCLGLMACNGDSENELPDWVPIWVSIDIITYYNSRNTDIYIVNDNDHTIIDADMDIVLFKPDGSTVEKRMFHGIWGDDERVSVRVPTQDYQKIRVAGKGNKAHRNEEDKLIVGRQVRWHVESYPKFEIE